jgi:hypothetical protein
VKRALLLVMVLVIGFLAWPAMTPGLFHGVGLPGGWRMGAEQARTIVYEPLIRWIRPRVSYTPVLDWVQGRAETFRDDIEDMPLPPVPRLAEMREILAHHRDLLPPDFYPPMWNGVLVSWFDDCDALYRRYRHHHPHPPGPPGAVPEPGVWTLLILGFGVTGAVLRRRAARTI